MPETTIEVRNLFKAYRLGGASGYRTLRESLTWKPGRLRSADSSADTIMALDGVDLTVEEGEVIGLIGRNGAGKTTLLKILSRITQPTTGVARTRGRVGALLEVGTGFHPELTGRENVFLNGSILGMSRRDVNRRFDEIAHFSGVERFLDTPLKRYSSGMRLRLAFSIAAHMEREIVAVDEVLAAGDAEFQRRCMGVMSDLGHRGRTVVFVSHDLGAVARLCSRVIWLEQGSIVEEGPPGPVIEAYLRSGGESATAQFPGDSSTPVQVRTVALIDSEGEVASPPRRDQPLRLRFDIEVHERVPGIDFAFFLLNRNGVQVLGDAWSDTRSPGENIDSPGTYRAEASVPALLAAGEYALRFWIGTFHEDLYEEDILRFRLEPRPGESGPELERGRVAAPSIEWHVRAGADSALPSGE